MNKSDKAEELILKYLSGELSEENKIVFEQLVAEDESFRKVFLETKSIYEGQHLCSNDIVKEEEKKEALTQLFAKSDKANNYQLIKGIGMVGVGVLVVFFILFQSGLIDGNNWRNEMTVQSGKGQVTNLKLPDGTTVYLNSDSKLTYDESFGTSNRFISLEGEAFFKVKSDKDNPFIVHTEHLDVRAVGTVFNVRSYDEMAYAETKLFEGKVIVSNEYEEWEMEEGDLLTVQHQSSIAKRYNMEDDIDHMDWMANGLDFDNLALSELKYKIERFYNVEIELVGDVGEIRFTGKIRHQTIDELLDILMETKSIAHERNLNRIKLYKK